ncbi:oxidoreductase [Mycolicibacter minnesotensis]
MAHNDNGLPDLTGKTVLITGANGGIGAETADALAQRGARVILACRNTETARAVAARIAGDTTVEKLDLADLGSVRSFAERCDQPIDILINNAGIMFVPKGSTGDGFELTFGTNHLGHFALTGLLLEQIRERIVTVSSLAHLGATRRGLSDPNFRHHRYNRRVAYSNSKVANLLFTRELNRRLAAAKSPVISVGAHPGVVATGLYDHSALPLAGRFKPLVGLAGGTTAEGAGPVIHAAVQNPVRGGQFFGPRFYVRGNGVVRSASSPLSKSTTQAQRLWQMSEELTQVKYL